MIETMESNKGNLQATARDKAKHRSASKPYVVQDNREFVNWERGNKVGSIVVKVKFSKADDRWLYRYLQTVESAHAGEILSKRFGLRRQHRVLDVSRFVMSVRSTMKRCGFEVTPEKVKMFGYSFAVYRKLDRFEALL